MSREKGLGRGRGPNRNPNPRIETETVPPRTLWGLQNDGDTSAGADVITLLDPEEPAGFDSKRLESLCASLGEVRAEIELAEALRRISATLNQLPSLTEEGDLAIFVLTLGSLARDADMIGMTTLCTAAQQASHCLASGDEVAIAASIARLERVGDRSIHAVWDLEEDSR